MFFSRCVASEVKSNTATFRFIIAHMERFQEEAGLNVLNLDGELVVPVSKAPAAGVREMRIGSKDIISRLKATGHL